MTSIEEQERAMWKIKKELLQVCNEVVTDTFLEKKNGIKLAETILQVRDQIDDLELILFYRKLKRALEIRTL